MWRLGANDNHDQDGAIYDAEGSAYFGLSERVHKRSFGNEFRQRPAKYWSFENL